MPLPNKGEEKKDYVSRFMSDEEMKKKYPDLKQRYALANAHWDKAKEHCEKYGASMDDALLMAEFEPPEAGDAPEGVKKILKSVYSSVRSKWVKDNPDDKESKTNKASAAKQAWAAVHNAGWKKEGDKWVKHDEDNLIELAIGEVEAARENLKAHLAAGRMTQAEVDKEWKHHIEDLADTIKASGEDPKEYEDIMKFNEIEKFGGPGSGNFGHSGRPGEVGGSGEGGGGSEELRLRNDIMHPHKTSSGGFDYKAMEKSIASLKSGGSKLGDRTKDVVLRHMRETLSYHKANANVTDFQARTYMKQVASALGKSEHGSSLYKVGDVNRYSEKEEFAELNGVEIFKAGTYYGRDYSEKDLDELVTNTNKLIVDGKHRAPAKLGHDESQKYAQESGLPALGWIKNLVRRGNSVFADFKDVPNKVYDAIKNKLYDSVSAEIYLEPASEREFGIKGKVLRAVALLGADVPKVKGMAPLSAFLSEPKEEDVMVVKFGDWNEELHPRETNGKFGNGSGPTQGSAKDMAYVAAKWLNVHNASDGIAKVRSLVARHDTPEARKLVEHLDSLKGKSISAEDIERIKELIVKMNEGGIVYKSHIHNGRQVLVAFADHKEPDADNKGGPSDNDADNLHPIGAMVKHKEHGKLVVDRHNDDGSYDTHEADTPEKTHTGILHKDIELMSEREFLGLTVVDSTGKGENENMQELEKANKTIEALQKKIREEKVAAFCEKHKEVITPALIPGLQEIATVMSGVTKFSDKEVDGLGELLSFTEALIKAKAVVLDEVTKDTNDEATKTDADKKVAAVCEKLAEELEDTTGFVGKEVSFERADIALAAEKYAEEHKVDYRTALLAVKGAK